MAHEGPGLNNVDWDFELASAKGFGETHAELLAQKMGGKGEYAVFVGSLTVPLHNAWADFANCLSRREIPRHEADRRTLWRGREAWMTAARPRLT